MSEENKKYAVYVKVPLIGGPSAGKTTLSKALIMSIKKGWLVQVLAEEENIKEENKEGKKEEGPGKTTHAGIYAISVVDDIGVGRVDIMSPTGQKTYENLLEEYIKGFLGKKSKVDILAYPMASGNVLWVKIKEKKLVPVGVIDLSNLKTTEAIYRHLDLVYDVAKNGNYEIDKIDPLFYFSKADKVEDVEKVLGEGVKEAYKAYKLVLEKHGLNAEEIDEFYDRVFFGSPKEVIDVEDSKRYETAKKNQIYALMERIIRP